MSPINLEKAIVRMYEDMSLTDQLSDETASIMNNWGEAQIKLMASRMDDEAIFDQRFHGLRRVMKTVNKFVGKRDEMDADKRRAYIRRIAERAHEIDYPAPFDGIAPIADAQPNLDEAGSLRSLLAFIETGSADLPGPDADKGGSQGWNLQ